MKALSFVGAFVVLIVGVATDQGVLVLIGAVFLIVNVATFAARRAFNRSIDEAEERPRSGSA